MAYEREAEALAQQLRRASAAAALTGAGVSAESGLPTFRSGTGALWRNRDPMTLATPQAFERDPVLVWEWYRERLRKHRDAKPNAGHLALVDIAQKVPEFALVTQNVDGLHAQAGSRDVIELHGCLRQSRCSRCGTIVATPLDGDLPPRCACGGSLRPNVVWFGENLPPGAFERALEAVTRADVFIVAGTSAIVHPAAGLVDVARRSGAFVAEVNPEETPATSICDLSVRAASGVFLPLVARLLTVE